MCLWRERKLVTAVLWQTQDFKVLELYYLTTDFLCQDFVNWLICSIRVKYVCVYVYMYITKTSSILNTGKGLIVQ